MQDSFLEAGFLFASSLFMQHTDRDLLVLGSIVHHLKSCLEVFSLADAESFHVLTRLRASSFSFVALSDHS
jgi:hypothetical protein